MNDTYKIRLVGGALMVVIPQAAARALSMKAGDELKVSVGVREITYERTRPKPQMKEKRK